MRTSTLLTLALLAPAAHALDTAAWKFSQPVSAEPGALASLELPDATLDAARADLADIRLVDAGGRAIPHLLVIPDLQSELKGVRVRPAKSFVATLGYNATTLLLETGLDEPVDGVELATAGVDFLKPVRVEGSADGEHWTLVADNLPVFRRKDGAANLRLNFPPAAFPRLRITVDDAKSDAVPFTGAIVRGARTTLRAALDPRTPLNAALVSREEKPGVTRLTLDLGASRLPLSGITFDTPEPLFTRRATVAVRDDSGERVVSRGTIWRISGLGGEPSASLRLECDALPPGREIVVSLDNGDSPPLALTGVSADRRQRRLLFIAPDSGVRLLSGNAAAAAPVYDLAPLASKIKAGAASRATAGAISPNADHRESPPVRPAFIAGARIDTRDWKLAKRVLVTAPGAQTLELDPETLCHARADLGDLRLASAGVQIPYLAQATGREKAFPVKVAELPASRNGEVARFRLELPEGAPPVLAVDFQSAARDFLRPVRLVREAPTARDGMRAEVIASADWRSPVSPDAPDNTLRLPVPAGALAARKADSRVALVLEVDNGANAPVAPTDFRIHLPVTNLRFVAPDSGDITLHFGNPAAAPPDYADLRLAAPRLLAAPASVAALGPVQGDTGSALDGRYGLVFWGALAALVTGLLFAVSRMLPKGDDDTR